MNRIAKSTFFYLVCLCSSLSASLAQNNGPFPPPATANANSRDADTMTSCDQYAASDQDPQRVGPGVSFDKISIDLAVPACREATAKYPTTPRFWFQLGRVYQRAGNEPMAVESYRKAANADYPIAITALGRLYLAKQNFGEAFRLLSQAAEMGSAPAQSSLGNMYFSGQAVPKNDFVAAEWFRKAANQGYSEAQYNLGIFYEKGVGVPRDLTQATGWFEKAASQGMQSAKAKLEAIKQADARREVDAKSQTGHSEPITNTPKQNPDDVVAQVLNYSRYGKDEGIDGAYFVAMDKCVYKLVKTQKASQSVEDFLTGGDEVIKLDELDPRLIRFQHGLASRILDSFGPGPSVATVVRYDTKPITYVLKELDEERLERGWGLIYEKFCTGKRKAF